jgi:hypothetical protein
VSRIHANRFAAQTQLNPHTHASCSNDIHNPSHPHPLPYPSHSIPPPPSHSLLNHRQSPIPPSPHPHPLYPLFPQPPISAAIPAPVPAARHTWPGRRPTPSGPARRAAMSARQRREMRTRRTDARRRRRRGKRHAAPSCGVEAGVRERWVAVLVGWRMRRQG